MDPAKYPRVATYLGAPRLTGYLAACGGDADKALQHYTWNTALSSSMWGPLSVVEVVVRNAMNDALAQSAGQADWWNSGRIHLRKGEMDKIHHAYDKLSREGKPSPSADDVVAATSMGLWAGLLTAGVPRDRFLDYEVCLWVPILSGAFPHRAQMGRRQVWGLLNDLRKLRNRVAHHEPIWQFSAHTVLSKIDGLLMAVEPDAALYVQHGQRLSLIHGAKPRFFDRASGSPI